LALQGSPEGLVVLTDSQTAGKGRLGRSWLDMEGCNVLSSTLLRPLFPPYLLVMIASLSVVAAITDLGELPVTIKWPNDVLIGTRKVAGILIETSRDRQGQLVAIVGIGVNVNGQINQLVQKASSSHSVTTEGLSIVATTLAEEYGHEVSRESFLAHLLHHLENYYLALQEEMRTSMTTGQISRLIREQWCQKLSTLGQTIQVRQGDKLLSGVAEDVNESGELLLRCHSGERISVSWGDVGSALPS
jgi:BirA family biotin operon repressor/biotin-[acetyl-CoA-carboxylase] ligase